MLFQVTQQMTDDEEAINQHTILVFRALEAMAFMILDEASYKPDEMRQEAFADALSTGETVTENARAHTYSRKQV